MYRHKEDVKKIHLSLPSRAGNYLKAFKTKCYSRLQDITGFLELGTFHILILWLSLVAACWFLLTPAMVYPFKGGWDETFYLAQATSFAFDLDYDIANDMFHTNLEWWLENPERYDTVEFQIRLSHHGRIRSTFPVGCSLLWVPALWVGRALSLTPHPPPRTTYTPRLAPSILLFLGYWSAFLCGIAVYACYRLIYLLGFEKRIASAAAIICFLLTPMAFWSLRAPGYSHMSSAFVITIFLLTCLKYSRERSFIISAMVGLTGGLVYIVRPADVTLLIIGIAVWLRWLVLEIKAKSNLPQNSIAEAGTASIAFLVMALFQWTFWKLSFGEWITIPQGPEFMRWSHPRFGMLLWSSYNAFLPWAPVVLISLFGLIWGLRRQAFWTGPFLLACLLSVYFASVAGDVQGGWSFGARRLTGLYPILAVGLAHSLRLSRLSRSRIAVIAAVCMAFILGMFLIRLRETGIRDLLQSWSSFGWTFGNYGRLAVMSILRSDYLIGIKKETLLSLPNWICFAYLMLLWASWQVVLIGFRSFARKKKLTYGLIIGLIGLLAVFHTFMIATNGRDDREYRAKIIGLKKAVRLKDMEQSIKLVEQLRDCPRFEMQASLIAAKFAWDQGRYDIGMLQLLPITKKIPQNTFPQLHKMLKKFYLEAVRRGQIKVK